MADLRQSHKGSESSQMDQRFEVGGAFYTRFRAFEACGLLPGSAASTYQKHGVPTKIYAVQLGGCVVASQTEFCLDFEYRYSGICRTQKVKHFNFYLLYYSAASHFYNIIK